MHQWRNWQTRMIQVHMGRLVQVQVLSGAPLNLKTRLTGFYFSRFDYIEDIV